MITARIIIVVLLSLFLLSWSFGLLDDDSPRETGFKNFMITVGIGFRSIVYGSALILLGFAFFAAVSFVLWGN